MSGEVHRYRTSLAWSGSTAVGYDAYDRSHRLTTDPPTTVLALSSAPAFRGDPGDLDPEQLLVAAASSCQCLSFLAAAARARVDVVAYTDDAEGEMATDRRPMRVDRITLRPVITVAVADADDPAATDRLHQKLHRLVEVGHRECFVANSLTSEFVIEPRFQTAPPAGLDGASAGRS